MDKSIDMIDMIDMAETVDIEEMKTKNAQHLGDA